MKRQPPISAIALLFVVGAALWGVNYRLDHPPLTKADKEFRALVAGADEVRVNQQVMGEKTMHQQFLKPLDAAQTQELIKALRFVDEEPKDTGNYVTLEVTFLRKHKKLYLLSLYQSQKATSFQELEYAGGIPRVYNVNPRFNKRLNRVLDAYLPQRVRP